MTPQCHIRLDSFKNNFFRGFMRLQHDEEFVDMTLVAEGHLVKVHKNILALASPYIKEVLQTAPCPHPVVFLTQIKKEMLSYILEYVYTGEVQVPTIKMGSFIEAAKALSIVGLENMIAPMVSFLHGRHTMEFNFQYSAAYQSEVLKNISVRNKTEQDPTYSTCRTPETTAETMQPTIIYLPELDTSVNNVDEDNNVQQKNDTFAIQQAIETIPSCEQSHSMEISNANQKVTEEIYNKNCTNTGRTIKIELDTIVSTLQSKNSKSNISDNNVTTAIATDNDIQNVKELWSDDDAVNVMDYTSEDAKNVEQNNIICPDTSTGDDNNLKSSETVAALDTNQATLFDFEAIINSAVTPVATLGQNFQQFTYNDRINGKKNETSVTETALLEPVAPHNQQFSFEITASNAENDTGKPMTITINPIEIELKHNTETKDTAAIHDCSSPLYTVSKRGRLMLILNRYMYNLHHTSKRKRRWRCIDYYCRGKLSCKAYVDTENEMVISRKFLHDHPFHDKKIFSKGHAGNIYTSIKAASNQMTSLDV